MTQVTQVKLFLGRQYTKYALSPELMFLHHLVKITFPKDSNAKFKIRGGSDLVAEIEKDNSGTEITIRLRRSTEFLFKMVCEDAKTIINLDWSSLKKFTIPGAVKYLSNSQTLITKYYSGNSSYDEITLYLYKYSEI